MGVPQGGVLSSVVSNVYLDCFDKFVEGLIEKMSTPAGKGTTRVNPLYQKLTRELAKLGALYKENQDKDILKEIRKLRIRRSKIPSRVGVGIRIRYVRYADD